MSFENILKKNINTIGNIKYLETYRERPHISKYKLEVNEDIIYTAINQFNIIEYKNQLSKKYIGAINIITDLFITIYNINLRKIAVLRLNTNTENTNLIKQFKSYLNKNAKDNLEIRLFGLQNNNNLKILNELLSIIITYKVPIYEIDLFGNEIRHIAIDLEIGPSFNILLENRLYRPGELINNIDSKEPQKEDK